MAKLPPALALANLPSRDDIETELVLRGNRASAQEDRRLARRARETTADIEGLIGRVRQEAAAAPPTTRSYGKGSNRWEGEHPNDGNGYDSTFRGSPTELGGPPDGQGGPEQDAPPGEFTDADLAEFMEKYRREQEGRAAGEVRARLLDGSPPPDQAAEDYRLAQGAGVLPLEVEKDRDTFRAAEAAKRIDALSYEAPKLRSWLDDPANFRIAHDDDSLSFWERAARSLGTPTWGEAGQAASNIPAGMMSGLAGFNEAVFGLPRAVGEAIAGLPGQDAPYSWSSLLKGASDSVDAFNWHVFGSTYADSQRDYARTLEQDTPQGDSWIESGIYDAIASSGYSVASVVASLAAGPGVGLSMMGGLSGGQAFGEARAAGKDYWSSLRYGTTVGSWEALTEALPLNGLLDDIVKGTGFGKMLLKNATAEGMGEQVATFVQDAAAWMELNPDKTVGEFLAERPEAAVRTLVASTLMSTVQTSAAKGADIGLRAASEGYQARQAQQRQRFFQALSGSAAESKLKKRLPEKYREAVDTLTKDGPIEKLGIPADQLEAYAQSKQIDPRELLDAMEVPPEVYEEALARGDDITVSMGVYAAKIAGGQHDAGLSPHLRIGEGYTQYEAETRSAEFEASFAEEIQRFKDAQDETGRLLDSERQVLETVTDAITATGLYHRDAVKPQAEVFAAMTTTLAKRTGEDPLAIWEQYGPRIQGSVAGEQTGAELAQRGRDLQTRTPMKIRDDVMLQASEQLTEKQFEAWKLAAQGLGNEEIAAEMSLAADEGDAEAAVSSQMVIDYLQAAKAKGFAYQITGLEGAGRKRSAETERLIQMKAAGASHAEVAAAIYPDRDPAKAVNQVRQLAHRFKNEIAVIQTRDLALAQESQSRKAKGASLYVAHNLSEANLHHAIELGGLAAPSLAVADIENGAFSNFGEITLLADPRILDDRKIRTFDADVYSPRQPRAEYRIDEGAARRINGELREAVAGLGDLREVDWDGVSKEGVSAIARSDMVKAAFFKERGELPARLPKKKAPGSDSPTLRKAAKLDVLDQENYVIRSEPAFLALATAHYEAEVAAVRAEDPELANKIEGRFFDDYDGQRTVNPNYLWRFTLDAKALRAAQSGAIDAIELGSILSKKLRNKKTADAFEAYVEALGERVITGKTLFRGFTNSGNRRYSPYTMENVLREMTQELQGGENWNYGAGSIRARHARELDSLEEIRSRKGQLVPEGGMEGIKDEAQKRLTDLLTELSPYYRYGGGNSFIAMDDMSKAIAEGPKGIREAFDFKGDPEPQEKIRRFVDYLVNLPTEYFEAKAQRAVGIHEFSVAVIPSDASERTRQILADAGVRVVKYRRNDNEARAKAIRAQSEILFQEKRGQFLSVPGQRSVITLFEQRDLSTFLHEASHWWLDTLVQMGAAENPHPFVVEQLAAIAKWKGLDALPAVRGDDGRITDGWREVQESFAETFEAYLRDGKAPTAGLREAFAAFRQWLMNLYRQVRQIGSRVNLTDDIRQVFDRMLATDEAIAAASQQSDLDARAMADAMKAQGIIKTDAEYQRTLDRLQNARDAATAEMQADLIQRWLRTQKVAWREEERKVRDEVVREVDQRPEQRAFAVLSGRGWMGDVVVQKELGDDYYLEQEDARAWKAALEALPDDAMSTDRADFMATMVESPTVVGLRKMQRELAAEGKIVVWGLLRSKDGALYAFDRLNYTHAHAADYLGLQWEGVARAILGPKDVSFRHLEWIDENYEGVQPDGLDQLVPQSADGSDLSKLVDAMYARKAGESAQSVWQRTGWAQTLDGEWVWEVPGEPRWKLHPRLNVQYAPLHEVIDWPELFAAMPVLRVIEVKFRIGPVAGLFSMSGGLFSHNGQIHPVPIIEATGSHHNGEILLTLRHEIQHAIQALGMLKSRGADGDIDSYRHAPGFKDAVDRVWDLMQRDHASALASGLSAPAPRIEDAEAEAAYYLYLTNRGETQARDIEKRALWSASKRAKFPPNTEPDVPLDRTWATLNELNAGDYSRGDYPDPAGNGPGGNPGAGSGGGSGSAVRALALAAWHGTYSAVTQDRGGDMGRAGSRSGRGSSEEATQGVDGQSLAQSSDPSRLDALGFFSAVQDAAKRVPDTIWGMGWTAARNAIMKGRGGARPTFEEMDRLGIDDAVAELQAGRTEPLRGAELKAAVTQIIAANRIMMERVDAILDPAKRRAALRKMTKAEIWDLLPPADQAHHAKWLLHPGRGDGASTYTLTVKGEPIVFVIPDDRLEVGYAGPDMRPVSVDVPVMRRNLETQKLEEVWRFSVNLRGLRMEDDGEFRGGSFQMMVRNRLGELVADMIPEQVIRNTPREDLIETVPPNAFGTSGDGEHRLEPGYYDLDERAKSGEIRMLFPEHLRDTLSGSTHSQEPGEAINLLWSIRRDPEGRRTLFLRQLQYDEAQSARQQKADIIGNRERRIEELVSAGMPRAEAIKSLDLELASFDIPLLNKTSIWVTAGVRALVFEAARQNMDSVAIPTAETSGEIQGNMLAAQHYETNVRGALAKIAAQLGGTIREGTVGSEYGDKTAYILDLTPQARARIRREGFPLFQQIKAPGWDRVPNPPNLPPMRLDLQAVRDMHGDDALQRLPEAVVQHSSIATDADQLADVARDVAATLRGPKPKSLWRFLSRRRYVGEGDAKIAYSGIRDPGGEIMAMIGERKAFPGLLADAERDTKSVRSYTVHEAAIAAWEEGYTPGDAPLDDDAFLNYLRDDVDGTAPLYREQDQDRADQLQAAERWAAWFDQKGVNIRERNRDVLRRQILAGLDPADDGRVSPDVAAELLNGALRTTAFRTGEDLLTALQEGGRRDQMIRDETRRRMAERHGGDPFSDGTLMEKARQFAANEIRYRQGEIELEALRRAAGQPAATRMAKDIAKQQLRAMTVKQVMAYGKFLENERRWMKAAIDATKSGKLQDAAAYRRRALVNQQLYVEGAKLAEWVEKTREHMKAFESKPRQTRLLKAGEDYRDQMNHLLEAYEFRKRGPKFLEQRQSLAVWFAQKQADGQPLAMDERLTPEERIVKEEEALERSRVLADMQIEAQVRNYATLTIDELRGVRDQADAIWTLAKLKDKLLTEQQRASLKLAAADLVASIEANQPVARGKPPLESDLPGEKMKRSLAGYMEGHRTLQSLAREFDGGKDGGVFWRYIVKPLNDAFARLSSLRAQASKDITDLFSLYTDREIANFQKGKMYIPAIDNVLTHQGRLAIALNWGTEKGRRRVMDSEEWTEAQVQAILATLDQRDWQFVQNVWTYLDSFWADYNATHEAVHGVPMTKEPGIEIATRFGTIKGGYYPIKFDSARSAKSEQRGLEADAKAQAGRVGTRVTRGSSVRRVEGKVTLPLRLSVFDVITSHVDEVLTSIATDRAMLDVGRLIVRDDVKAAIQERHGMAKYRAVLNTLREAKNGQEIAREAWERFAVHLRNGQTIVGLGLNLMTAALQPLGLTNSVVRVGGYWIARGVARAGRTAVGRENAVKYIIDRSEMMANRERTQSRELADLRNNLKRRRVPEWVEASYFFFITKTQFLAVDVPTWFGQYEKSLAAGATEEDAAAHADQAVIDAQGSGDVHNLAGVQRGSPLWRLFTNFMSYMVTTYNLSAQRIANARVRGPLGALALGLDMLLLWSVPVAGSMFLRALLTGGGDDDGEDEDLWVTYLREQVRFLIGPFALLNQLSGPIGGYGYRGPQGLGAIGDAGLAAGSAVNQGLKAVQGEEAELTANNFWRPANRAAGAIFHYPANQIDRSARGILQLYNGETDDWSVILFGPKKAA